MMTKRDLRLQVAKVTISVIGQNNDSNRSYNSWKTVQDKHHGESQIYMYSSLTKCDSVVGYITSERLGKLTKYLPDGIFFFFFSFSKIHLLRTGIFPERCRLTRLRFPENSLEVLSFWIEIRSRRKSRHIAPGSER